MAKVAGDQSIAARGGELKNRVSGILQATDAELGRLVTQYRLPRTFSVSDEMPGGLTVGP
ncbi:MAG: hypothetical protein KY468_07095 [Armatimonadetes bacterium]|nr:hypothetical protein [Armatimonadota bacterium]